VELRVVGAPGCWPSVTDADGVRRSSKRSRHRVVRWCRKGRRARRVMIAPFAKGVGTRGNFLRKVIVGTGGTRQQPTGHLGPPRDRSGHRTSATLSQPRPTLQEKIKSPHQNLAGASVW